MYPRDLLTWRCQPRPRWSPPWRVWRGLVITLIDNWYSSGGGVDKSGAVPSDDVPSGWQMDPNLYNRLIKPYCRMCHIASVRIPFNSYKDYKNTPPSTVQDRFCNKQEMPHAQVPFESAWSDPATPNLAGC